MYVSFLVFCEFHLTFPGAPDRPSSSLRSWKELEGARAAPAGIALLPSAAGVRRLGRCSAGDLNQGVARLLVKREDDSMQPIHFNALESYCLRCQAHADETARSCWRCGTETARGRGLPVSVPRPSALSAELD